MIEETLKEAEQKFQKTIEMLKNELVTIHTGRANVSLVDDILVDVYGTKSPIKAIANITIPEPRSILIQAWDRGNLSQIESAIRESDLKLSPVNTGENIRVNLPELTEERRKEFVKIAHEKAENARISIRSARGEAFNTVKKAKNDGQIGEDDMYRGEQELQKLVDRFNKEIDSQLSQKEQELLTI